ncbi:MAG: hypothetical protein AAFV72_20905 [Cyanobacteria bacterium J06635_1]
MNEQLQLRIAGYWRQKRGIESIDHGHEVVLVRASLDELFDCLKTDALEAKYDVVGSTIMVRGPFTLTYQLSEHVWSAIVPAHIYPRPRYPEVLQSDGLLQLSKYFEQPVIKLIVSTGGTVGYVIFDMGEFVEYFSGIEDRVLEDPNVRELRIGEYTLDCQQYSLFPYPDDFEEDDENEGHQTAFFWSTRRSVTAEEIGSIWGFANGLLFEYEAFDLAAPIGYFLEPPGKSRWWGEPERGHYYRVRVPKMTAFLPSDNEDNKNYQRIESEPNLVGIDYFRWGS